MSGSNRTEQTEPQQQVRVRVTIDELVDAALAAPYFSITVGQTLPAAKRREIIRAAIEAVAPLLGGSEAELSADPHDPATGEKIAQWLYRNGMRETAFLVRSQLDMRGPLLHPGVGDNGPRKLEHAR